MDEPQNLFEGIPTDLPQELVQVLHSASGIRIERIVSRGHASPEGFWYDQPTDEWVLLLEGAARIHFHDDRSMEMNPGSFIHIPAHSRHCVEWTDPALPTIWLAIHHW